MIRSLPKDGIPFVVIGDGKWGKIENVAKKDFVRIERVSDGKNTFLYMLVKEINGENITGNTLDAQSRMLPGITSVPLKEIIEIQIWAKKGCFRLFYHVYDCANKNRMTN